MRVVLTSVGIKDTLSNAKVNDLTFKAKDKDMMYDAKFKALQKVYLGHAATINSPNSIESYVVVTRCHKLHLRYSKSESILSPKRARGAYNILFPRLKRKCAGSVIRC